MHRRGHRGSCPHARHRLELRSNGVGRSEARLLQQRILYDYGLGSNASFLHDNRAIADLCVVLHEERTGEHMHGAGQDDPDAGSVPRGKMYPEWPGSHRNTYGHTGTLPGRRRLRNLPRSWLDFGQLGVFPLRAERASWRWEGTVAAVGSTTAVATGAGFAAACRGAGGAWLGKWRAPVAGRQKSAFA